MEFHPLHSVPKTDEEVIACLYYGKDELIGACLVGIYQVKCKQRLSLLDAYEHTLRTYLEICEKKIAG